ncbi:COP9 signalosome complex subunit 7 [Cladophialophora carrionii]|uniref:COP9 signalosome complex subunit 7 n=1 Tax=Cladophialophora carrionii TaxID=86049 RepID=A0A1C1CN15_9EURO|nr:COP9 signalosome complex subunit 7 [Cladophialophora carrionii]
MDQVQTKSLAAIQPIIYQITSSKNASPRFVAELIKGAISDRGAYIFTELLQLPTVQALRGTEFEPWLTLLEIFSWGTYEEYKGMSQGPTSRDQHRTKRLSAANPSLPQLDVHQTLKLRQLTLLTLASPFSPPTPDNTANNLTYAALLSHLQLSNPDELEGLITASIDGNLLTARLYPTSSPPSVHIISVAPLRDLRPQSLPTLLQILQTWESRCVSVVSDLESQIATIRATAQQRALREKKRQDLVDSLVLSTDKPSNDNGVGAGRAPRGAGQKLGSKRDLDQHIEGEDDDYEEEYEGMDLDEGLSESVGFPGGGTGSGSRGGGGSRGAKRNRGRGSK